VPQKLNPRQKSFAAVEGPSAPVAQLRLFRFLVIAGVILLVICIGQLLMTNYQEVQPASVAERVDSRGPDARSGSTRQSLPRPASEALAGPRQMVPRRPERKEPRIDSTGSLRGSVNHPSRGSRTKASRRPAKVASTALDISAISADCVEGLKEAVILLVEIARELSVEQSRTATAIGPEIGGHEGPPTAKIEAGETPRFLDPRPAAKLRIQNPRHTGLVISYQLNGQTYSLPPGETHRIDGPDHVWLLKLHRGGDFGYTHYELTEGSFVLDADEGGWCLERVALPPTPALEAQRSLLGRP
jgi:hypothetical protein